jgi:hypothetical protein
VPEPNVYRPRRIRELAVLVIGICSTGFGLLALGQVGAWYFGGAFLALGILAVVGGVALLCLRVVVDDGGLAKRGWFGNGFTAFWDGIERWLVAPYPFSVDQRWNLWSRLEGGSQPSWMPPVTDFGNDFTFISQVVLLKLRGMRWPVAVYDSDAYRPSFRAFVEDIRSHARSKEVA